MDGATRVVETNILVESSEQVETQTSTGSPDGGRNGQPRRSLFEKAFQSIYSLVRSFRNPKRARPPRPPVSRPSRRLISKAFPPMLNPTSPHQDKRPARAGRLRPPVNPRRTPLNISPLWQAMMPGRAGNPHRNLKLSTRKPMISEYSAQTWRCLSATNNPKDHQV